MGDLTAIAPLLKSLKGRLAAQGGARLQRVLVFGSYVRGDAQPDSDVDVAVVLSGMVDPMADLNFLAGLSADITFETGAVVNMLPLSVDGLEARTGFLASLRREAVAS